MNKELTKFEIVFKKNYISRGDILDSSEHGVKLKVLDEPTWHYSKWYFRLLRLLTFGYFFNMKVTYTVEMLKNEITGTEK